MMETPGVLFGVLSMDWYTLGALSHKTPVICLSNHGCFHNIRSLPILYVQPRQSVVDRLFADLVIGIDNRKYVL